MSSSLFLMFVGMYPKSTHNNQSRKGVAEFNLCRKVRDLVLHEDFGSGRQNSRDILVILISLRHYSIN